MTTRESIDTLLDIYLVFPDVQQQCNQSGCGLFALALTSNVCQNVDPVTISYDQKCFYSHFPCDTLVKSKFFCVCHLPVTGDCMIKCDLYREWYIYKCWIRR